MAFHYSIGQFLVFLCLLTACAVNAPPEATPSTGEMVVVPAGWFMMGQDEGPPSNQPQRKVYLDAFAIDRTEVTGAAFARFVAETGFRPAGWEKDLLERHASRPVVGVLG